MTLTDSFSRLAAVSLVQVAKERWEERDVETSLDGFCYKIEKKKKKKNWAKARGESGVERKDLFFLKTSGATTCHPVLLQLEGLP